MQTLRKKSFANIQKKFSTSQTGMTTTEFVLTIPPFLFLVLLCIEFSLMSIDRHLLTAATHAAARGVLQEALDPPPAPNGAALVAVNPVSSQVFSKTCESIHPSLPERVTRKAAVRLAATAPGVDMLTSMTGIDLNLSLPSEIASLGGSMLRVAKAYPVAKFLTSVVECEANQDGVKVTLEYLRHPRTPWAGTAMWALYALGQMNKDSGDVLKFDLDNMYFGVKLTSPALNKAQADVNGAINTVKKAGSSLTDFAAQLRALPGFQLIQKHAKLENTPALNALDSFAGQVTSATNDVQKASNDVFQKANGYLKDMETVTQSILYSVPEILRVIPMKKTIFLAWPQKGLKRHREWDENGTNAFLNVYKQKSGDTNNQIWEDWSKGLATGEVKLDHEN